jgi:Domain of unknown function (DUF4386)
MEAKTIERTAEASLAGPDPSWRGLYRAGSIAAILFLMLTIVSIALVYVTPQPPSTGETGTLPGGVATLNYIIEHKAVYLLNMVVFVGPVSLTIVVFLALFVALQQVSKSIAAIGALVGIVSVVLCEIPFAPLFGLVPLSDQYAAATTAAQRAAVATTADGLLAQVNTVSVGGVLFAVGVLLISFAMLRGVFHKAVALVGILTGVIGIICESLRPIMGASYSIYSIMLIWLILVGWKLYRLSQG